MILVGQYDSPYVRRVAVSLHVLELPFERDTRSVFRDAEAMRRINPLGRIPSLVLDDGEVVIDSAAILDHLDEVVGPARALLPPRAAARRRALRTVALATGAIDKAGTIVDEQALRPADKQYQPWLDRCRTQIDSALAELERITEAALAGGARWHGGERLMQADTALGSLLGYLRHFGPEMFPAGAYPALERISDAYEAQPAFARAHPRTDEQPPGAA